MGDSWLITLTRPCVSFTNCNANWPSGDRLTLLAIFWRQLRDQNSSAFGSPLSPTNVVSVSTQASLKVWGTEGKSDEISEWLTQCGGFCLVRVHCANLNQLMNARGHLFRAAIQLQFTILVIVGGRDKIPGAVHHVLQLLGESHEVWLDTCQIACFLT